LRILPYLIAGHLLVPRIGARLMIGLHLPHELLVTSLDLTCARFCMRF
jgi:hypothetical protein